MNDIYLGVPVIIGSKGVEKVIEENLDEIEKNNLKISIDAVKELYKSALKIDPSLKNINM